MNTAPYEQIRTLHGAVWHRSAKLKLINQIEGDWGNVFGEQNYDAEHTVQAYTVEEILRSVGWPSADYVKCDIEGAELEIFSDPSATAWLQNVSSISVETHDRFKPGCTEAVERALPPSRYMHRQSGEFHVFTRSTADCDAAPLSALSADLMLLVPRTLRLRRFDLINIPPDAWGFCTIDDETFQLHPRPPGQGRSEIQFHLNLSGQCRFSAQCHLPAKSEWPVIFSARLIGGDRTDLDKARTVSPGETTELRFDIPRTEGQCRVALGTEMSPEASTNGFAWAQWKRPCLE
jgi:hypothetical protein